MIKIFLIKLVKERMYNDRSKTFADY